VLVISLGNIKKKNPKKQFTLLKGWKCNAVCTQTHNKYVVEPQHFVCVWLVSFEDRLDKSLFKKKSWEEPAFLLKTVSFLTSLHQKGQLYVERETFV